MSWHQGALARLRAILRRGAGESELDEEFRFHLEMEVEKHLRAGLSPDEARRRARVVFGGVDRHKEAMRDGRRVGWIEGPWQDLRYAVRGLARAPGFALVAVLTLALGIGAATAVFSVVNAVLLRPLPFPDADRLHLVWSRSEDSPESWLSHPEWMDLRERSTSFTDLAVLRDFSFAVTGEQEAEQVAALAVSANLFRTLGVRPLLGRAFSSQEDRTGAGRVAILSHGFWQRRFGGDPGVLGRAIMLDGEPHTVIGVLHPSFRLLPPSSVFPSDASVLVPLEPMLGTGHLRDRDVRHLHVIGRLRPHVPPDQAQMEVQRIAGEMRREHSGVYAAPDWGLRVVGYQDHVVRGARAALWIVFGAVGFLLLLAAVNVANLLLARHAGQTREIAVRGALGASRGRLLRLRLLESGLLALLSGVAGVLVAEYGVEVLRAIGPANLPRLDEASVDARVLGFALLAAAGSALAFGLIPALHTLRSNPGDVLRGSSRATLFGPQHTRTRRALVVSQLALAVMLLVGTGLLLRSMARLRGVPTGFQPAQVLTVQLAPAESRYPGGAERSALVMEVERRLASLPGVRSVGAVTQLPLSGASLGSGFFPEGEATREFSADLRGVSPDYLGAMGIRLLRGRAFTDADGRDSPWVAIVDETFADRLWPGQNPIGKRLRWKRAEQMIEVVGVAAAVRHTGLADAPVETVYRPYAQYSPATPVFFALRTDGDPNVLAAAVRREIRAVDPDQPVAELRTMEERVQGALGQPRFYTLLMSASAGVALLLAVVGLYGVIAFGVAQRTHEIGVRTALGAARSDVLRLVLGEGLAISLLGVGFGLIAALGGARLLRGLLFQVHPSDPWVFTTVPLLLVGVAVVASYLPARRAAQVDPATALRSE